MGDSAASGVPSKPIMRNFVHNSGIKIVILSLIVTGSVAWAYRHFYSGVKINQSLVYFSDYDIEAAGERMGKHRVIGAWMSGEKTAEEN